MLSRNPSLTELELLTTSPKILIVDDSESDRLSYVRYLRSASERNYHIVEVETLEEGLALWRSQEPEIVLLDINLPDGDGLDFLETIRTDQPSNKLPVIVLTGQGDERIAVRAMKLGAADYLVKSDVTAVSLLTCINQVQENNLLFRQLLRSQEQQTLIASLALHIRRSLNFTEVASQTVEEIRRLLKADRTIIYRFNSDMSGVIVAEAVVPPWLSCLNVQVEDTCFQENLGGEYQRGKIFAAVDIYAANLTECHIQLLERFQIRANLVVPILLNGNDRLWGLLIAHQCSGPRQWLEEEIQLLHQLSIHLAIALKQAELYHNLEITNNLLEEKVQERTKKIQLQSQVLEEIHDGVVTTDSNGIILSWNRGSEKLYGYTEAEVLGRNVGFIYEDGENLQSEVLAPVFKKGKHTAEVIVISKSGKRIYVSLHLSVVKDEQGNITHLIGCANDITERKRAEQELQQLNQELETKVLQRTEELQNVSERLGLALKSGAFGCWEWNLVQNTKIWNKRMYELYELPQQEDGSISYEDWANRLHPEDRTSVETLLQQAVLGEAEYKTEFRIIHPDESIHFIKAYGMLVRDEQGHPQTMIGINFDISDRKRIEAALRESEAKFRRLVEGANDVIWSANTDGVFTYLSPQFQTIFGFDPHDWIGQPGMGLVHPEDIDGVISEQINSIQSAQKVNYIEFRHLHQKGHYVWVSVNCTPIIDADDIVIGLQGILTDISERKKAEQELLENQRLIQQIADSSPNVLYLYDIQEQCNAYANREILTILGYSASDVQEMGAAWLPNVMHPDDLPLTLEHFERLKLADDHEIFSHEYRLRHAKGQWRYFHSRDLVFSRDDQGQVKLIIGTAQDISDRKLAEAQLKQKNIELEELVQLREEALTLREDMSNMIIHDLRNPLSAILLSAEMIKRYGDRPDKRALTLNKAEQILTSSKRLKSMIDSLLLMAKLESGKIIFNPVATDLHELGTAIISDFELTAQTQKIKLKAEFPNPGNSIVIDPIILRRVIENLLSNALKFSPANSQVWLQMEYLPKNHLRVRVKDNGPGVSSDKAQAIFEKFDIGTVKPNVAQIGLGLAFCKMAVEAQGGTLEIAPNQPNGSIFTVRI